MKVWGVEPAMIVGALASVVSLLVAFGVPISGDQQEAIKNAAMALMPIIAAYVIRSQVIPTAKVEAAHGSEGVEAAAAIKKSQIASSGTGAGA